jgi:hypothetical protein
MNKPRSARNEWRQATRAVAFSALALGAGACGNSPSEPSSFGQSIANLRITQLGLAHEVCPNSGYQYLALDELTFDTAGRRGAELVGSTVHQVRTDGTEVAVGNVEQCPETFTRCQTGSTVCLTKSSESGGTVRVRTYSPWTPQREWRVFLRHEGKTSNTLAGTLTRQDNLPFGNAGIAFFDAYRIDGTTGLFSVFHYNPGVSGRRFTITRELWFNGNRGSTTTSQHSEDGGAGVGGVSGGVGISTAPTEMVVTLEERDASGMVIHTERHAKFFR